MDSRRLILYFRRPPEADRWVWGDRWIRPFVRRIVRGKRRPGGLDKVFGNLVLGLREIGQPFLVNVPFGRVVEGDRLVFLGVGRDCFGGYALKAPIVAGIGIVNHPREFPDLCERYPVAMFLQASEWACDLYRPVYGDRCVAWPIGIDTEKWRPLKGEKTIDFLVYHKILWQQQQLEEELVGPMMAALGRMGATCRTIRYGHYAPEEYADALARCRAMIYLSCHESQGIAYQEALSMGIPLLAWDSGRCWDPSQADDSGRAPAASSVPYFDARCGMVFSDAREFEAVAPEFLRRVREGRFDPRAYILEHLTLARCARRFVELVSEAL